jgi:hypothetical protein
LNAVSIGFDVTEWEGGKGDYRYGGVATRWALHEISVVPVPMDAQAVVASGRSLRAFQDLMAALSGDSPASAATVDPAAARRLLAAFTPTLPASAAKKLIAAFGATQRW